MKRTDAAVLALVLAGLPGAAWAFDEGSIVYKPGPGLETVQANCLTCHGFDYILMNSFQDRASWTKTVHKMINTMRAPISEEDSQVILGYLTANYGK